MASLIAKPLSEDENLMRLAKGLAEARARVEGAIFAAAATGAQPWQRRVPGGAGQLALLAARAHLERRRQA